MSDGSPVPSATVSAEFDFAFGPYRLLKDRRCVVLGDAVIRLGGRAFDLLVALLDRAGEVVSRRELEQQVWPRSVVEETSLRVHISSLRRAFGDGQHGMRFIENVPGRGYCFVAPVVRGNASASQASASQRHGGPPPPAHPQIIGRTETLARLKENLQVHRLVTIAGPGGIGKTTLARALAQDCSADYPQGAAFVDLAPIRDGALVASTIAGALDLVISAQDAVPSLAMALRDTSVLVVLDNCEHVIDAVACVVEQLLGQTPVRILATSREPINVNGECTHLLVPLALPRPEQAVTARQALQYSAIELFVTRAAAASEQGFNLDEHNVEDVIALARQLDGLPLALELVAARVPSLGVRELSSRIGSHLALVSRGRRTAPARHQTLSAMLAWSYQLLSTPQQIVLRRLSIFCGSFSLEAALAVASDEQLGHPDVLEAVLALATKSLISVDASRVPAAYRLLDTTRTFAAQKLAEAEAHGPVARRHALEMQKELVVADADYDAMSRMPWMAAHASQVADIRAALDWCFSEGGDLQIGIQVMVNALPLHELGLLAEQTVRIERALAFIRQLKPPRPDLELRLNLKLTWPSLEPDWSGRPTLAILSRATELAERLADPTSRIGARYCTWLSAFVNGDYASAMRTAQDALSIAQESQDAGGVVLAERLLAQCHHFMGDHRKARLLAERTLSRETFRLPPEYASAVPRGVSMRIVLARILWLEGFPDRAARMADECLALAEKAHCHAQLQTLGFAAIPISLWRGDTALADDMVHQMTVVARKGHSPYWGSWARSFSAVVEAFREEPQASHAAPRMPVIQTINAKELDCMASVAPFWHHAVTQNRLHSGACEWSSAEILRKQGEYLMRQRDPEPGMAAEDAFRRAMDLARRQGALAWELRAALSLARAWIGRGRFSEARELVAPIHARFTEGFETADLRLARTVVSS